jgi:hypothetical protein
MKNRDESSRIEARLDAIAHLLEDIFILQAVTAKMGRENIRTVLGVHTTRISKVMKGLRKKA